MQNVARKPSGDVKPQIVGRTPEQLMRALKLVGDADLSLAQSPLGVLVARKAITNPVWNACNRYAAAYCIRYGTGRPSVSDGTERGYDHGAGDAEADAKNTLSRADRAFEGLSNRQRNTFDRFVVFQEFPGWIYARIPNRREIAWQNEIVAIAEALHEAFGHSEQRAA